MLSVWDTGKPLGLREWQRGEWRHVAVRRVPSSIPGNVSGTMCLCQVCFPAITLEVLAGTPALLVPTPFSLPSQVRKVGGLQGIVSHTLEVRGGCWCWSAWVRSWICYSWGVWVWISWKTPLIPYFFICQMWLTLYICFIRVLWGFNRLVYENPE